MNPDIFLCTWFGKQIRTLSLVETSVLWCSCVIGQSGVQVRLTWSACGLVLESRDAMKEKAKSRKMERSVARGDMHAEGKLLGGKGSAEKCVGLCHREDVGPTLRNLFDGAQLVFLWRLLPFNGNRGTKSGLVHKTRWRSCGWFRVQFPLTICNTRSNIAHATVATVAKPFRQSGKGHRFSGLTSTPHVQILHLSSRLRFERG